MRFPVRAAVAVPAIALASFAIVQVAHSAYSDHLVAEDTPASLAKGSLYAPDNAYPHARIAELDPMRKDELEKALALNANEPSWWIMRSARQEQDGDVRGAESSLHRAVAVSRYFVPWWSLSAFYYRQEDAGDFIPAARQAVTLGSRDLQSLFQMADALKIAPEVTERQIVPDSPDALESYLAFVLDKPDLAASVRVAERLVHVGTNANRTSLLAASERLLFAGYPGASVDLWNRLIELNWLRMNRLDPAAGLALSDGEFKLPRVQTGFDWRIPAPQRVTVEQQAGGGIRLDLDGRQPENCELLRQYLPLLTGRSYRLKTRFRTTGLPPESGLRWSVVVGENRINTSASLAGEAAGEQVMSFTVPAKPGLVRLSLSYTRMPGMTRIEGQIFIESVALTLLPDAGIH